MNYELAKKLKDVGFRQNGTDLRENNFGGRDTYILYPTLSELIEVCGDSFCSLSKIEDTGYFSATGQKTYLASPLIRIDDCKSPEEAVANLWLKLNE